MSSLLGLYLLIDQIALVHWSRHHIRQHLMVWRQQLPGWRQRRQTEQSHALSLQRHRTRAALRHWLGWSARHKLNTALMGMRASLSQIRIACGAGAEAYRLAPYAIRTLTSF